MGESSVKFVGFAVGVPVRGDESGWPTLPDRVDGDATMHGEDEWIGAVIAAFPSLAAERLHCAELLESTPVPNLDGDLIREAFDVEADTAQQAWNDYRARCAASGFDPGEGDVMFVCGRV